MENRQIQLLLTKWEEIHKKLTEFNDNPAKTDFFEDFEQDMISFLREFYRLKEGKENNVKTKEQHLKYSANKSEILKNHAKTEEIIHPIEDKKDNTYPTLESYFSLNDKFLFLREIFDGNKASMNHVMSILNTKLSLNDSLKYMEEELSWDIGNPSIAKLIEIIEKRFENKKIWESYS